MNEFRPGDLWLDNNGVHINAHGGGILYHRGIYYWFGEHKIEGEIGNSAQVGVHVYSSADLYHWKDEGIALAVEDSPNSEITRGCFIERPKVIFNAYTGKFVMWFHLEFLGKWYYAARSAVAVADRPTGPYKYVGSMRPNAGVWPSNVPEELKRPLSAADQRELSSLKFPGEYVPYYPDNLIFRRDFTGGQMARDMGLFLDDDGAAYHLYSSEENGTLHISQLSDDFLKSSGPYVRVSPKRFNEAPTLMKRRNKYYLISSGCTGWTPNAARLTVADSIWGPWTELGNPCVGTEEEKENTFGTQSTFILQVPEKNDGYIFMADLWRPTNPIDGRYVWLPIQFQDNVPYLEWIQSWNLGSVLI